MAMLFPSADNPDQERKRKAVEAVFIEYGLQGLVRTQRMLKDEAKLKSAITGRTGFYGGGAVPEQIVLARDTRDEAVVQQS